MAITEATSYGFVIAAGADYSNPICDLRVFEKSSRHTMAKLALLPLTFHSTQWAVSEQLGKPETTASLKNTQSSNLPLRSNPIIWSCALKGPNHISLWLLSSAGMRLWASCLIQQSQGQA